jgi:uncharacterized protein YgiM (DUF1202 family)
MYGVGQSSPQRRGLLVILGVFVIVLVLVGLFYAFYALVLKKDSADATATPETTATVQVVGPVEETAVLPTNTPTSRPTTPTVMPTIPATNTPAPSPTLRPPPEVITIGVRARVNISEGLGLNLRDLPSLSGSTVITQLVGGSEVNVIDGPEDVGDLTWWNVNGGEGRVGWVVEAFGGETWLVPIGWSDQLPPLPTPLPTAGPTLTPTLTLAPATPVVTPTVTPELAVTATPVLTPTATPVLTPTATPEGGIPSPIVGGRAQVTTRYQFVNLRQEPGLGTEPIGQLANGTIVRILEGPEEVDDIRWWKVEDDEENTGWVAERVAGEVLLTPIQ